MKRTLNLPEEAATAFYTLQESETSQEYQKLQELSDIALINTAFKLLTTNDPRGKMMARQELIATTQKRGGTNDPESITQYISGSLTAPFDKSSKAFFKSTRSYMGYTTREIQSDSQHKRNRRGKTEVNF